MAVILPLRCVQCGRRLDLDSSMGRMPACPDCGCKLVPAGVVRDNDEEDGCVPQGAD